MSKHRGKAQKFGPPQGNPEAMETVCDVLHANGDEEPPKGLLALVGVDRDPPRETDFESGHPFSTHHFDAGRSLEVIGAPSVHD